MADTFDIIIVGGGPGGYVAAIRAAQLGMKTALVEREHLGGICLNWGCIPTKALLRASELYDTLHHLDPFGLAASDISFDITKVVKRSRDVAQQLSNGVKFLMRKHKVTVFDGTAKLTGPGTLSVTKDGAQVAEIESDHIILATGARPRVLPGLEPDGKLVWTSKEAMVPPSMPKSLLIVGSGAIGMEFASFYRSLGAEVTVAEILPQILPVEDEEISTFARKAFEKQGMTIHTGTTVSSLERQADSVTATLSAGGNSWTIHVDRVISAVGVQGNVENLGLEGTKVQVDRGFIKVNEWLETGEPGIYAIGDVAGPPCLAHKAMHEGVICVERIAGVETARPMNKRRIPGCTYCHPQIASVGYTEKAAKDAGFEVRVGRFPFQGNGKAIALGESQGLVKTVFDAKTGELLGAHMVGAEVTELIQGYVVAMTLEATEEALMEAIFPHPTLSEMMHESVLDAYGRALHI
ncbi:MAG: dihydrolipoyl dehydrogenase [Dehalococcoidia bacterium]